MNLRFDRKLIKGYTSPSQIARVLTEDWVKREVFCPSCGEHLESVSANQKVKDFVCSSCIKDFELKSKKAKFSQKIVDGQYDAMMERVSSATAPHFLLLNYQPHSWEVRDFAVVPSFFFTPRVIEKRQPLKSPARRAGWVGCNILYHQIPESGKIFYVKDQKVIDSSQVRESWDAVKFMEEQSDMTSKGWMMDIMWCIESLAKKEFKLDEIYAYESYLQSLHPENRHIKDKIRQQLQVLRDKGYLEFVSRGVYRRRV
jgi:type II restriction enzyme